MPSQKTRPPHVPPGSRIEKTLASIWMGLLGCDRVGLDDDFFDLGGHSLKATRLVSRIHKAFQKEIDLGAIFSERTVRRLAQRLESTSSEWKAIPRVAKGTEFELSFAQRRMWALHHMEDHSVAYNSTGFYWVKGQSDLPLLQSSIVDVIQKHVVLRTVIRRTGDALRMFVRKFDTAQVELIRGIKEESLEAFAQGLAQRSFRLDSDPLFLVKLLVLDSGRVLLALHMHHIVSDGGSLEIFQRQVMARYRAAQSANEEEMQSLQDDFFVPSYELPKAQLETHHHPDPLDKYCA